MNTMYIVVEKEITFEEVGLRPYLLESLVTQSNQTHEWHKRS